MKKKSKKPPQVKRLTTGGGPGWKQCPNCKGDYFPNARKVCPDCNKPFKKEGDLPGQKQLPLENGGPQPDGQTVESSTAKPNKGRRTPRTKSQIVKVFTVKDLLDSPAVSLTIEQMADYMRGQLNAIGSHYKKVALHIYYLGEALVTAKEQFVAEKRRDWGGYLDDIGISPATATRARQLYDFVDSPEDLADMTITDAYRMYGILQPKLLTIEKPEATKEEEAKQPDTSPVPPKPETVPPATPTDDGDFPKEEVDISEDKLPESKPEEPSEDDEGQATEEEPASVEEALAEVTDPEMESFVHFVKEIGSLKRVTAIIETCLESYAALYGG